MTSNNFCVEAPASAVSVCRMSPAPLHGLAESTRVCDSEASASVICQNSLEVCSAELECPGPHDQCFVSVHRDPYRDLQLSHGALVEPVVPVDLDFASLSTSVDVDLC